MEMEKVVPTSLALTFTANTSLPPATTTETTATTPTEPVFTFNTGSLSVRKDMMARLPAMHIPDFKRNLRDLDKPSLKINELNLNSALTSKLTLSKCALRVLNTPNVRTNLKFFFFFFRARISPLSLDLSWPSLQY